MPLLESFARRVGRYAFGLAFGLCALVTSGACQSLLGLEEGEPNGERGDGGACGIPGIWAAPIGRMDCRITDSDCGDLCNQAKYAQGAVCASECSAASDPECEREYQSLCAKDCRSGSDCMTLCAKGCTSLAESTCTDTACRSNVSIACFVGCAAPCADAGPSCDSKCEAGGIAYCRASPHSDCLAQCMDDGEDEMRKTCTSACEGGGALHCAIGFIDAVSPQKCLAQLSGTSK